MSRRRKLIDFKALLDSGAGLNIFPGELGQIIGLNVINDKVVSIGGLSGHSFEAYLHEVVLGVGEWRFNTYACFTFAEIMCPVLGREGFFELFEIKIDYLKKDIELKSKVEPLKS